MKRAIQNVLFFIALQNTEYFFFCFLEEPLSKMHKGAKETQRQTSKPLKASNTLPVKTQKRRMTVLISVESVEDESRVNLM
jgi:hypothetical protein